MEYLRIRQNFMEFLTQLWISLLICSIAEGEVINSNQNVPSRLIPCEDGWFFFGSMCYKIFERTKGSTWMEAQLSCYIQNASLASIQNKEMQDFLSTFLLLDAKSTLWIGLYQSKYNYMYRWDDNSDVSYTNWDYGYPIYSRFQQGNCVEMFYYPEKHKGVWTNEDCDKKRPFICQSNKTEQSLNRDPRFCTDENEGAWRYMSSCYHTVDKEMTWDDAENYCQTTLKGHLLSVLDPRAELFLKYVLSNFSENFWIGIKIREDTRQAWSPGWTVKFQKWQDKYQRKLNGTCAHMTKERLWSTAPCFHKLPFVCEVPNGKLPALKQAPEGWRCPELSEDWIDLGGDSCYIFETSIKKRWHEANFVCLKKGGHLAIIHSIAETNALLPHIAGTDENMFIGLHRSLLDNSVFEWVDGTEFDFENWAVNQPNNKNEACVEVWYDDMVWSDVSCDQPKRFICSAKKVPPTGLEGNETDFIEKQPLEDTKCSGNISSSTMYAVLVFSIAVSFLAGLTIYNFAGNCRKFNNHRSKGFAMLFTPRDQRSSLQLKEDELHFGISN